MIHEFLCGLYCITYVRCARGFGIAVTTSVVKLRVGFTLLPLTAQIGSRSRATPLTLRPV